MNPEEEIVTKYITNSGFYNFGNTCYMNSLLQCFFSIKELYCFFHHKKYLENNDYIEFEKKQNEKTMCYIFHKLIKHKTKAIEYLKLIQPVFDNENYKFKKEFVVNTQQDVYETYGLFFQIFNYELGNDNYFKKLFEFKTTDTVECSVCEYKFDSKVTENIIIVCCDNETDDLNHLIQEYSNNKILDDPCRHCDEDKDIKGNIITKKNIELTGDVIIIFYNRTQNNETNIIKMKNTLKFPIDDFEINKQKYNLIGVIYHIGSDYTSGHYVARCKSLFNNKWYEYNDSVSVKEIDPLIRDMSYSLDRGDAYMLFYRRK